MLIHCELKNMLAGMSDDDLSALQADILTELSERSADRRRAAARCDELTARYRAAGLPVPTLVEWTPGLEREARMQGLTAIPPGWTPETDGTVSLDGLDEAE